MRPELLADAFAASGARVFFCQPLFQNPTGAVLAPGRRRQVLDIAHAAGAFVIEDDFARRLGHGGPLPPPLIADDRHGTVVHVRSLTKPTSPSLRVGALIARGPVLERLRAIQVVDSFFVPRPLQEATLELVGAPAWPRHLRAVAAGLRERRAAMLAALDRRLPGSPPTRPLPAATTCGCGCPTAPTRPRWRPPPCARASPCPPAARTSPPRPRPPTSESPSPTPRAPGRSPKASSGCHARSARAAPGL